MSNISGGKVCEGASSVKLPTDDVVAPERENWHCKVASSRADREAAFRLIYQAYLRGGLGSPNMHQMRVTPYHLLPTTTIFNAQIHSGPECGEVFSTVSLVGDGAFGLPLERVYSQEVAERRERGISMAEVSCLADRRSDFRRFFPVFCAMNRLLIQFARAQGYDQLLVAVHPKHARFYTRNLGFDVIGELTEYPTVRNRPAVPLCYDFAENDRKQLPGYTNYFSQPLPREQLLPAYMSDADVQHFGRMVDPAFKMDQMLSENYPP
ncbi:MAG TPA: long-chain N-acyl amino acid synthase [Pirellulaceae bacterium]|nr:long-chain N-acyl amino acid synthase [Pirellulaceae bacterium]